MRRPPTRLLVICSLITWLLACPTTGLARDYRLNVGQLPLYAETKDRGILIDVIKAMDEEYQAGRLIIEVYPFERSIHNVAQGLADLHFPIVGSADWGPEAGPYEEQLRARGLRRSTCSLTKSHFALYRHRDRPPLDLTRLDDYRIETDAGHRSFFEIPIQGTTCLPCSVEKLSAKRIDGLVFASREIDLMIREAGLTNIARQNFRIFGSKFILPNTAEGAQTDAMLCEVIGRMIRKGSLARVARPYSSYFLREYGDPYLPDLEDLSRLD
ncbi:hypothetical protein CKO42_13360 [Lamprobacter modestohalophilus]|uniref:Uncharacterized protein n=1 Tax=Lamprobacter modestohalophilus TaxID=1064514 RepID=A0A9X1B4F6_9GAMM|nr:hypothetical protein [Lamprobacter modestohalophilus]MBK1619410.1 hypothetical protein [Lamprobacter modestohalophilus]